MARPRHNGMSPFAAGLILLVLVVIGTYFAFSQQLPFRHPYKLDAVFRSGVNLRQGSPVRIAGVTVGKVTGIGHYRGTPLAVVHMEISKSGLPIRQDARLKIRPRLFLEGNFFVDVQPGSPSAHTLDSGSVIPVTQTADPVQLDQVLTMLQSSTREDLRKLLQGYGTALTAKPTAAEDASQDPGVRGLSAAEALNKTYDFSGAAFRDASLVNLALLGSRPHDLSSLIASAGRVSRALDRDEPTLQDLIVNFNTTMAATARQAPALERAIALLGPTLVNAHAAFTDLDRALPPTRAFALEIIPGVEATPATIRAARPWLAQMKPFLSDAELGGLTKDLAPATADLAKLTADSQPLLGQLDEFDRCITHTIIPTGNIKVDDGPLSSGTENYKEFWYSMVGLAGEGQSFDGNGQFLRLATGGGGHTIETGPSSTLHQPLFGNAISQPLGTRPAYPGKRPPYVSSVPCYRSPVPDVNGLASRGPADNSR
jgi:phospholipid/cholesterol/gamma-HCH transport system substrate-binding protein